MRLWFFFFVLLPGYLYSQNQVLSINKLLSHIYPFEINADNLVVNHLIFYRQKTLGNISIEQTDDLTKLLFLENDSAILYRLNQIDEFQLIRLAIIEKKLDTIKVSLSRVVVNKKSFQSNPRFYGEQDNCIILLKRKGREWFFAELIDSSDHSQQNFRKSTLQNPFTLAGLAPDPPMRCVIPYIPE